MKVMKTWGKEQPITEFNGIYLKELHIAAGSSTSMHYHEEKVELFYVVDGEVVVHFETTQKLLSKREWILIEPNTEHSTEAVTDSIILEIGTTMFGDVTRVNGTLPAHE